MSVRLYFGARYIALAVAKLILTLWLECWKWTSAPSGYHEMLIQSIASWLDVRSKKCCKI